MLTFHWKHTCAVDLLHVKCCENMPTQPHRCHETLNSYKTNVFLIQSTILFLCSFLLILWKILLLMKPFAWWGLNFQFVVLFFSSILRGTSFFIQLSSDIVKVSSIDEAFYCLVGLSSCLCFLCVSWAFLEEV